MAELENSISCVALKGMMDAGSPLTLIDVREPEEYDICRIEGAILIPLGQLSQRLVNFDKSQRYVVHCKSGGRSGKAVAFMKSLGFKNVQNLEGGILQWAMDIDAQMELY